MFGKRLKRLLHGDESITFITTDENKTHLSSINILK